MKGVRWRTAADDEAMLRFQANLPGEEGVQPRDLVSHVPDG